jgi:hypothetical protein
VDEQEPAGLVREFASKYGLTSTFLMDPSGELGFNYRVRSTPTTFFLDTTGEIQAIRIGVVSYGWLESNVKRALN